VLPRPPRPPPRDNVSTWCEFIPQVIFLNSLFGYLSFLILLKWATGEATDLYHVLIYMFLSPGQIDPTGYAYPYQGAVQVRTDDLSTAANCYRAMANRCLHTSIPT